MSDRCSSTALCSRSNQEVFEKLGYRLDAAQALNADGDEISGALVMVDEQAAEGHYDELTSLKGVPFVVSNTACPGAFDDHLIVSDGAEWVYTEALHESNYPAVRVDRDGEVGVEDLATAHSYWRVYSRALIAIEEGSQQSS
jgi:hypothetical protein